MDEIKKFEEQVKQNLIKLGHDKELHEITKQWVIQSSKDNYVYNFKWMGRPVIQFPQDMVAMQEIIWEVKPDLIIETGIAHGGSLIMNAGYMEMMGITSGQVLGIDIDIREHNRRQIQEHPMYKRITMFEGSSVSDDIARKVKDFSRSFDKILVSLDSNHSHQHVLKELEIYSDLVSPGSYCVVCDTSIDDYPQIPLGDRPWGAGDNPKTAVDEFLKRNDSFVLDKDIKNKLVISCSGNGYLKRIK